jgi:hypothetical protein
MTTNGYTGTTLSGRVEAVNDRGIKLGGDWLNVSRWRPLELPAVGATVTAVVDIKGFLTSVTVLEQAPATPAVVSRDATITRLAVLKAAAYFCGQRATVDENVRSTDVLKIATAWLAWVDQATTTEEAF